MSAATSIIATCGFPCLLLMHQILAEQAAEEEALHPGTTIVPLRGYKRAMVKSMIAAGTIPHFHLCDELDMRALMALRHQIKGDSVLQGVHLTFLPIMIKVSPPPPARKLPPPSLPYQFLGPERGQGIGYHPSTTTE